LSSNLNAAQLPPEVRQSIQAQAGRLAAIQLPPNLSDEATLAARNAIDAAFVAGYRTTMFIAAGLALASAVTAALMISGKRAPVAETTPTPNLGTQLPNPRSSAGNMADR
jgi:hypothetical protein